MTPATATEDEIQSPLAHLSEEQIEELAKEFDAIHDDVYSDLGEHDRRYITAMIEFHRRLAVMSRVALLAADFRPAWVLGTVTNSTAKILENMEIGHNVMHGQWDWMNDPQIHSSTWDWDTASTAEAWKHSHNYVHHTFTNIRGKDKDLGYEIMRIDPHQKWHPVYLFQPLYNLVLMAPLRVGRRLPRHGPRGASRGREEQGRRRQRPEGHRRQGPRPDRQGLRRLARDLRARRRRCRLRRPPRQGQGAEARPGHLQEGGGGQRNSERRAQPVVARDHLLRALSRSDLHLLARRRPRTRAAARGTCASSPAQRTSRAVRSST